MPNSEKLRGGYYTPKPIADFLAKWAINSNTAKVLEPSCGNGNILESIVEVFHNLNLSNSEIENRLYGVEVDPIEAKKSVKRLNEVGLKNASYQIHNGDFFNYCKKQLLENKFFDVVIGNPPFIRYQNFLEEHRVIAFELMQQAGLNPNRLTNSWVPFLIASSLLLKKDGRLAMVIPAELFQVNYTAETRRFLSKFYSSITIITFKKLVFEGIQQEIVLILADRNKNKTNGIRVVELDDIQSLKTYKYTNILSSEIKPIDHSNEKWTQYFLSKDDILFLRALKNNPNITISGKVMDVDVGVVTGLNEYFLLNEEQTRIHSLESYTLPIVSKSNQLQGIYYSKKDWNEQFENKLPVKIFMPPNSPPSELPKQVLKYVDMGEKNNVNKGYKCSIRKRWYNVPSVWIPEAFMLRQVHSYPKIILNKAKSTCTDTIHRVKFINNADGKIVSAAFINSLTFAFTEITGRSYGGGVLTFEPSETEKLPLPLKGAEKLNLEEIDKLLRKNEIEKVLNITDKVLLIDGLGLSPEQTKKLRNIWKKLRDRRINRKNK